MPVEEPEIFSGFLRFSTLSSLFQNSNNSKNKKMPDTVFDLLRRTRPVELTSDRFIAIIFISTSRNLLEKRALIIRKYEPSDCKQLSELFYQTVHNVVKEQQVVRNGIALTNYLMEKKR